MLKWSNRIDALIGHLKADFSDLQVSSRQTATQQPLRIIVLRPSPEALEAVELVEGRGELIILFGVNLRIELGLTDEHSATASLGEARQILRAIIIDGYEEHVWVRKNGVVRTVARINYAGADHRFATTTLTGFFGGRKETILHRPW